MQVPDDIDRLYQEASKPQYKLYYLALLLRKRAEEAYDSIHQPGATESYTTDYWTGLAEGSIKASKELTDALLDLGWLKMDSGGNGRVYQVVEE